MDQKENLVPSKSGLAATGWSLAKPSEITLLNELDLTATNSKTVMEPRLSVEFLRALEKFPLECIEAAFRGWRDVSPYFPAISDIKELCQTWTRLQREETERLAREAERDKLEEKRAAGELVDFVDIKTELLKIAQFPAEPTPRQVKQRAAIERLKRAEVSPALQLTKEQIAARREAEQAEIQRELKRNG